MKGKLFNLIPALLVSIMVVGCGAQTEGKIEDGGNTPADKTTDNTVENAVEAGTILESGPELLINYSGNNINVLDEQSKVATSMASSGIVVVFQGHRQTGRSNLFPNDGTLPQLDENGHISLETSPVADTSLHDYTNFFYAVNKSGGSFINIAHTTYANFGERKPIPDAEICPNLSYEFTEDGDSLKNLYIGDTAKILDGCFVEDCDDVDVYISEGFLPLDFYEMTTYVCYFDDKLVNIADYVETSQQYMSENPEPDASDITYSFLPSDIQKSDYRVASLAKAILEDGINKIEAGTIEQVTFVSVHTWLDDNSEIYNIHIYRPYEEELVNLFLSDPETMIYYEKLGETKN